MGDMTRLLVRAREGDRQAFDTLFEALYPDLRVARVVEMRCFGGMKNAEIGQAPGFPERTVRRDWERRGCRRSPGCAAEWSAARADVRSGLCAT